MKRFFTRRVLQWISTVALFFILPIGALATVSFTWTPAGERVKSPVVVSVSTTGDFADTVNGIGCDMVSFTNWMLRVVGDIGELFGDVMGVNDKSATFEFALPDGFYTADIACSDAPVQQNNGQSNNPALTGSFEVVPWSYLRTPSDIIVPNGDMTLDVAFDDFSRTGCALDATSWRVALYDSTGEYVYAYTPFVPTTTLTVSHHFTSARPGDYGTVELECMWNGSLYGGSAFLENGNGETIFTVPYYKAHVDELLPTLSGDAVRPLPTVTFASPKANARFAQILPIAYDVNFDHFDTTQPYDVRGLSVTDVSLHYANEKDGIASTTLLATQLPAKGEYSWEVVNLPERDDYRIVLIALDVVNRLTTLLSDTFAIDRTPPAFRFTVDPPVSQGEEVTISVDAEEDLDEANPPRVRVEQQSAGPITLTAKGSGKHFEVVYYPVHGFDGEVKMTVEGQDKAGNKSNKVVSGGLFYIGIEPPPKPVVTYPLENDVFSSGTTSVIGVSRPDTEVALHANGTLFSRTKVDGTGGFRFDNVPVSRDFQRGINLFSVVAFDQAGHQSEAAVVRVKYNVPPNVVVSAPKDGAVLTRAVAIRTLVRDDNNDSITFTYEASDDNGATWLVLAKNTKTAELKWRTMDFLDGDYILRVTADDGYEKDITTTGTVRVRNYLPRVEFAGKTKTVINTTAITVTGTARAENPEGLQRSPIRELEYRVDDEKVWHKISKKDDERDEFARTFSFELSGLTERVYAVQVRATDERGFHGVGTKTVIVDYGPPDRPTVTYPLPNSVLSQAIDEDPARAGVQFSLRGKSEPHALVRVVVGDAVALSGDVATSGAYVIPGVTLREHGENTIRVTATDLAGNESAPSTLKVLYNNPPTIKFRSPRVGRGINHQATIKWEVSDPDGDTVLPVTLSWRSGNTGQYKTLATKVVGNSFAWDVSQFTESKNYELRLEASDGTSSSVLVQQFTIDNTPPEIALIPLAHSGVRKEFTLIMEGDASDLLSGVEYVEYSIDGKEWYKGTLTKGYLGKQAHFRVKHPFILPDGKYILQFRAVDATGNVSAPATQSLIVDTTPPRIGSYTIGIGTTILSPTLSGLAIDSLPELETLAGESLIFTQSLESDTASATLHVFKQQNDPKESGQERSIPLVRDLRTGLWVGSVTFDEGGVDTLAVSALDRLGNSTERVLVGRVYARPRGVIRDTSGVPVAGARVSVLVFNEDDQRFIPWNGKPYGLVEEKTTDASGEYAILLPAGTYRFLVERSGFVRVHSGDFTLDAPHFVSSDFLLKPREGLRGAFENFLEFFSPI